MFVRQACSWAGKSAAGAPTATWSELLPSRVSVSSPLTSDFVSFSCLPHFVPLTLFFFLSSVQRSHWALSCPCCTAALYTPKKKNVPFKILVLAARPPKLSHFKAMCENLGQTTFSSSKTQLTTMPYISRVKGNTHLDQEEHSQVSF